MMINRRRVYGGSKKLPYDAEIEYLESSGTQYIDTGYSPVIGDSIHIEFLYDVIPLNENYQCLYSAGTETYQFIYLAARVRQDNGAYHKYFASGAAALFIYYAAVNTWYTLDVNGNGTATINNHTSTSTPRHALDGNSTTLWLLLRRNNTSPFKGKIRRFWLENNGVRKLDLIPVRVDNIGYLYDKVSGQLFGNAGTGEFILGPDR